MQYYLDINKDASCYNNPVYGSFTVNRQMENSVNVHRILGMDKHKDRSQRDRIFDLGSDVKIVNGEVQTKILSETELKVYSNARIFGFAIPRNFLSVDCLSFSDMNIDVTGKTDSIAYHALGYFQILMHVFSSENIALTWNSHLKNEIIQPDGPVATVNEYDVSEDNDDEMNENSQNGLPFGLMDDSQSGFSETGRPISLIEAIGRDMQQDGSQNGFEKTKKRGRPPKQRDDTERANKKILVKKVQRYALDGVPSAMCAFPSCETTSRLSNETVFHVVGSNESGKRQVYTFPRVTVDIIQIPKEETDQYDGMYCMSDNILYDNEECYFVVFTINDPVINVNRGIRRLIENNKVEKAERERQELKSKKRSDSDVFDPRKHDMDAYVKNLSCVNQAKEIMTVESVIEKMGILSTNFNLLDTFNMDPEKNSWDMPRSVYDPCVLFRLKPETDSNAPYLWAYGQYQYEKLAKRQDDLETAFDNDKFLQNRQLDFASQFFDVVLDGDEIATGKILLYSCPNRVFRYSQHHINAYLVMNTIIPFFTYTEKQMVVPNFVPGFEKNCNMAFPPVPNIVQVTAKKTNQELVDKLSNGSNIYSINNCFSCEQTRKDLFGIVDTVDNISISVNKPNVPMVALRESAMQVLKRSLHGRSLSIPTPLAAIMRWIETGMKSEFGFSLFVSFYGEDDESLNFRYFKGLSCHSHFFANIADLVYDETLAVRSAHSQLFELLLLSRTQYSLNFGFQTSYINLGTPELGKSYAIDHLIEHLVEGTYLKIESESKLAKYSDTSEDAYIIIRDDIDKDSPMIAFKGAEENALGSWKTSRTSGRITRFVLTFSTSGRRLNMPVVCNKRNAEFSSGNLTLGDIPEANQTRGTINHATASKRRLTIEQLISKRDGRPDHLLQKRHRLYTNCVRGMQAFSALFGYLTRGGAIYFNRDKVFQMSKCFLDRFIDIFNTMVGGIFPTEYVRLLSEKLPLMVEQVMIQRIYCMVCSGCFVEFGIGPGIPFTLDLFQTLSGMNVFMTTDEDFIISMSFFERMFAYEELRCFAKFIQENLTSRNGYDVKGTLAKTSPEGFYKQEGRDMTAEMIVDYNRINLSEIFVFQCNDKTHEPDLMKIAEIVANRYKHIEKHALYGFLKVMFSHVFPCKKLKKTALNTVSYCMLSSDENSEIACENFNVLERIPVRNMFSNKQGYIWALNRGWYDSVLKPDYGIIKGVEHSSNKSYYGSMFEVALRHLKYEGMTKIEILLPGMTYNRVNIGREHSGSIYEMPHIFKTAVYDGFNFSKEETKFYKSLGLSSNIELYVHDDESKTTVKCPFVRPKNDSVVSLIDEDEGTVATEMDTSIDTELASFYYLRIHSHRVQKEGVAVQSTQGVTYTVDPNVVEEALLGFLGDAEGQLNALERFSPIALERGFHDYIDKAFGNYALGFMGKETYTDFMFNREQDSNQGGNKKGFSISAHNRFRSKKN